ncbi:ABC transporter substrate-binding protein [soil metagenome]
MQTFTRRFGLKVAAALGAMAATGSIKSIAFAEKKPVGDPVDGSAATVGGDLIVRAVELGDTMDPHKSGSAQVSTILRLVGDTLIAKDYDGNFIPYLAKEWTISEDGLTWTFMLRDDVKFHDGTPLDAEAVRLSFDRILDPATSAVSAKANVGTMIRESLTAVDAYTFQFKISEPFAPLLQFLTASVLSIISPTAIQNDPDGLARKPILSGQFLFDEWREGDRVVLKRNPDFNWGPAYMHAEPAGAFLESITFQSITEDASAVAAFEAGEIQQLTIPATDISRFEGSEDFSIVTYERQGIVLLAFNVTKAPFDDLATRFALLGAINKTDVLDAAVEGYGHEAHGYLSPTMPGYDPIMETYAPAFDPEAAKTALAAAGWADADGDGVLEKDGEKFEFTALNLPNDSFGRAAQIVQAQLADIGVSMIIQQMEFATVLAEIAANSHQAVFMGYTYTDPDVAYQLFDSSQTKGINLNQISDPHMDELILTGRTEMDVEARWAIYSELQKYVNDQGLYIPLWYDSYFIGFDKTVKGAAFHPDNYTVYYDAYFEN